MRLRNGQILVEHYGAGEDYSWGTSLGFVTFGLDTLHDLRSVTKSIAALLFGIALGERRVRYGRHKIVYRTELSKSVCW